MTPTQHFGDLQVAFAQLLPVGRRETFGSKAAPGVRHGHGHGPLPVQLQPNEQVENANRQHGDQEEDQRGNQDDKVVYPGGLDHSCGWKWADYRD